MIGLNLSVFFFEQLNLSVFNIASFHLGVTLSCLGCVWFNIYFQLGLIDYLVAL